ncbi:MAG: nitroreductase family protein [Nanoarchaeota archaeon]|nr:nitroreductase family protein [Nanoarchaeota archaeon]
MEVKDAIIKRKSIRKYKDLEIPKDLINEILDAARLSPSAYNAQPWKFKIINDKNVIKKLKKNNVFKNEFVYTAPLIIVCCGDTTCYPERAKENFELKDLSLIDVTIACQSLILRATDLGLGTCYVGLIDRNKLKKILNISKNYIISYVITVGYPDLSEELGITTRKKLNDIIL